VLKTARKEKDQATEDTYKLHVMRANLMLLVGTTIFSNKAKNYVDLTYLDYFRNMDPVATYSWGTATLAYIPISGLVKWYNPQLSICGWLHDTTACNIYLI
jgi:hypothetical protein